MAHRHIQVGAIAERPVLQAAIKANYSLVYRNSMYESQNDGTVRQMQISIYMLVSLLSATAGYCDTIDRNAPESGISTVNIRLFCKDKAFGGYQYLPDSKCYLVCYGQAHQGRDGALEPGFKRCCSEGTCYVPPSAGLPLGVCGPCNPPARYVVPSSWSQPPQVTLAFAPCACTQMIFIAVVVLFTSAVHMNKLLQKVHTITFLALHLGVVDPNRCGNMIG
jgi:hypothetical protein